MALSDDNLTRLRALVADGTFTARFAVEREIGAGGMGRVYAGVEREGGMPIAIKVLDPGLHGDPVRFATEAAMLEQLDHPTIVRYVAHGLTGDGRAYLAMQWLDGESLSDRLKRAPLTIAEAVAIGQRVADALAYLHTHQIVHRDIKPSNVLLVDRDPAKAIVIDLGIAKRLSVIGPTKTGEVIGTPGYMAPEQVRGDSDIDERVDMFALGCLLYETVGGVAPFGGPIVMEVLARLLLSEPRSLDTVRPDVPPRLATLVAVLLAKRADDRTIDAVQASRELSTIARCLAHNDTATLARSPWNRPHSANLGEAPTLAATPTVRDRPRRQPRSRLPVVLGIAGALALVGIGASGWAARRPERARPVAVEPGDAAVPVVPIKLPATVEVTSTPGPRVAGTIVDALASDQLGVRIADATWCAARQQVVLLTTEGKQLIVRGLVRATGRVESIATLALPDPGSSVAVVCLASGRLLVGARQHGFVIDGGVVSGPIEFPTGPADAVAAGGTAHWLFAATEPNQPGTLLEWSGDGPPKLVRETCISPRKLSPDGKRVACLPTGQGAVAVDDGKVRLRGPSATSVQWSEDGKALYATSSTGTYQWIVKRGGAVTFVTQGFAGTVVGSWLFVPTSRSLARHWIGSGPPRSLLPLEVGVSTASVVATIPEHAEVVIALGSNTLGLRIVKVERGPPIEAPIGLRNHHLATITGLVFDPAGTSLLSLANDQSVLVRALAKPERSALPPLQAFVSGGVAWRSDGTIVATGGMGLYVWNRARELAKVTVQGGGSTGAVVATDHLIAWTTEGVQELRIDGTRGGGSADPADQHPVAAARSDAPLPAGQAAPAPCGCTTWPPASRSPRSTPRIGC
ncbi:MAG: WD40 repeat domain-containing serine/threonine protein kinase [Kofleriaceae bacterium]